MLTMMMMMMVVVLVVVDFDVTACAQCAGVVYNTYRNVILLRYADVTTQWRAHLRMRVFYCY